MWKICEATHRDELLAVNLHRATHIWVSLDNDLKCEVAGTFYTIEKFEDGSDAADAFIKLLKELNGKSNTN